MAEEDTTTPIEEEEYPSVLPSDEELNPVRPRQMGLQGPTPYGRPPGSKNVFRPGFRELTYEVLHSMEMGGLQGYIDWAKTHKNDFYSRLCPKLFGGEFNLLVQNINTEPKEFVLRVPMKALDSAEPPKAITEPNPIPALDPTK